ncbi:MAG: DUF3592 domain-containing protein [Hyphomicrobiales bacterium]|nr:DUF3592 domain-containing protein [Hyphomicrobiales bacterium]
MSNIHLHLLFMSNPALRRWTAQRLVFLFPVLMLLAAAGFFAETIFFQAKAKTAQGEVVRVYTRQGENFIERGKTLYSPVLRYTWSDGKQTSASTGQAHSTPFREGEKHTVLFDPSQKGDVRLATFEQLWAVPATLALIGLGTLLLAFLLWFALIRPRIKREWEKQLFCKPRDD